MERSHRKEEVAVRCRLVEEELRSSVAGTSNESKQIDFESERVSDDVPNTLAADRSQDTSAEALPASPVLDSLPAVAFLLRTIAVDTLPSRAQSSPCSTPRVRRREDL